MTASYQIPGRAPQDDDRDEVARYWRERFADEPYYVEGERFENYEGAYIAGHEARVRNFTQAYEQVEAELHRNWDADKGSASLAWSKARHAVRRAWERAGEIGTRHDPQDQ